jgi:hypothetical protein
VAAQFESFSFGPDGFRRSTWRHGWRL